jgi:hypothetical protein
MYSFPKDFREEFPRHSSHFIIIIKMEWVFLIELLTKGLESRQVGKKFVVIDQTLKRLNVDAARETARTFWEVRWLGRNISNLPGEI